MSDDKRILIFEPVPADAELIELQIRKTGLPQMTRRASTKDLFDRMIGEFHPDVVIAEHGIPRCDVLELMRRSREEYPDQQWVIIAGSGNEELAAACFKAGAADYLSKKNLTKLAPALKAILTAPVRHSPGPDEGEEAEEAEGPVDETGPDEEEEEREPPGRAPLDLFRGIVESSPDLIAVLDLDGKRLYNSPSYGALLEDPDTLEGTSSFVDVHPDDREKVKRVFQETVGTGIGQRLEYRLVDRDGNIRYIESHGSIIQAQGGTPARVVIFSRDITARRQAGEVIRAIAEEIARLRGSEFFPGLVRSLARSLGVRYALVSECVDHRRERVRALAYWASGGLAPVFEYDVKNTTCEQVVQHGRTMYFAADVQELFQEESALRAMDAYAYLGVPLLDATSTPIGHLFVIHDQALPSEELARSVMMVTAARVATELEYRISTRRLAEGESQYRTLLEEMSEGVIVTDTEDVIKFVNGRMSVLSGYSREEMVGKLATTLLVPDEERRTLYLRNERRREGISERYTASLLRKDGSRFAAVLRAVPHRSDSGAVIGSLALISPTEGEESGARPAADDAGLLEKAQDAVFVCDPDDGILFWNNAAAQLYGWTADEARGKISGTLLHTEAVHRVGGAAHTALIEGYWSGELRQQRKDGTMVLVDSRWTLVRDGEGKPKSLLVICTDITGKRELEIYELRARRMEGIATLASALAADLDRLLTPVMLAVPALAEKASDDSSRQAVALVAVNAQRGLDMANQVLALSENAGAGRGLLDSVRLFREIARTAADALPESIRLETSVPRSLWPLPGILSQLQQVVTNVCTNAREAMPGGGVLRLAAENLLIDAQTVAQIPHALPGKYVLVTVSDTGHGIPQEIVAKVFEPFFTTKPSGRTTGLGLSTAAAIVRNHKGFINLFSEPGQGTIVKMYLPAEEQGEAGVRDDTPTLGNGELVLVAQQQASLRDIVKKILDAHGYDAITAADGAEAVALYRRHQDKVRAVIIDLDMPYMDGSMTIRVLQRTNASVRIIATGEGATRELLGVSRVLPRPFSTPVLLNAVREAISPETQQL